MTSNHHAPYDRGYTRATMAATEGSEGVIRSEPQKSRPSSDCSLQPDYTKLESLVIADQHAAVNTFPGLPNRKEGAAEGGSGNWGEVVTR